MGLSATSPTSLLYYGSFCDITNISVMGLFATSQTSLSYYWSYCDITKTSVILWIFCDVVLWVFLRDHKHLCHIMGLFATSDNISAVLRVFLRHQKHFCRSMALSTTSERSLRHHERLCRIVGLCTTSETSMCYSEWDVPPHEFMYLACTHMPPHCEHRFPAPSSKLRAPLSGTFLQTLPDLVTPLKGHSLSPRSCQRRGQPHLKGSGTNMTVEAT